MNDTQCQTFHTAIHRRGGCPRTVPKRQLVERTEHEFDPRQKRLDARSVLAAQTRVQGAIERRFLGDCVIERGFLGDCVIERDFLGDCVIERGFLGEAPTCADTVTQETPFYDTVG